MNGLTLLVMGAAVGCYSLLRAMFRDGEGFHDRLADFTEHTDQALAVVDGARLTAAEETVWVDIVAGYGRRGSIA